jgi:hypothetical protein
VLTAGYLLHLLDSGAREQVLREAARVLVPGGRLGSVTVTPPAGAVSSFLSAPIRALARRSPRALSGMRPLDPRTEFIAAGLRPVEWRRTYAGYPSLCVVARREA